MAWRLLLLSCVLTCAPREAPAFLLNGAGGLDPRPAAAGRPGRGAGAAPRHTSMLGGWGDPGAAVGLAPRSAREPWRRRGGRGGRSGGPLRGIPIVAEVLERPRKRHLAAPAVVAAMVAAGLEVTCLCAAAFLGGLLLMGGVGGLAVVLARAWLCVRVRLLGRVFSRDMRRVADLRVRGRLRRQLTLLKRDLKGEFQKEKALQLFLWQSSGGVFGIFGKSGFLTSAESEVLGASRGVSEADAAVSARVTTEMITSVRSRSRSQSTAGGLSDDEGVSAFSLVANDSPGAPAAPRRRGTKTVRRSTQTITRGGQAPAEAAEVPVVSAFDLDFVAGETISKWKPKQAQGGGGAVWSVVVGEGEQDGGYCVMSYQGGSVVVELPKEGDGFLVRAGGDGEPVKRVWADGSPVYQRFSFQTQSRLVEKVPKEGTGSLASFVQGGVGSLGRWEIDTAQGQGEGVTLRNKKSGEVLCLSAAGLKHSGGGRVIEVGPGGEWSEVVDRSASSDERRTGQDRGVGGGAQESEEEGVASDEGYIDVPEDLVCPILHELMQDPWVAADGYSYERSAISSWLKENDTSPVTGEKLASRHVMPNNSLLIIIKAMLKNAS